MRTIIIAEAGVNHNGNINMAKDLIDTAANCGADYVKFQTFITEQVLSKNAGTPEYQKANLGDSDLDQYSMIKKLEFSKSKFIELFDHCKKRKINFLSTAFDLDSLELLNELGLDFFKIPSGEINNYPYLKKIAGFGLPVVMSTGMANLSEIEQALEVLLENGLSSDIVTILHCNTEYPTPMKDVNLRAMLTIRDAFKTKVGYSDHTLGIEIPIAAVALGASIVEKHFTLDRSLPGPDHKSSLEPDELKAMIIAIRNIELGLGDGIKSESESEKKNKNFVRKSLFARVEINKGEKFTANNIIAKRPGIGISPMRWEEVLSRAAGRDFKPDELIDFT